MITAWVILTHFYRRVMYWPVTSATVAVARIITNNIASS